MGREDHLDNSRDNGVPTAVKPCKNQLVQLGNGLGAIELWRNMDRVELVGENSFAPKVLPMSPEWTISKSGGEGGIRSMNTTAIY
jgi:hypothetical protein